MKVEYKIDQNDYVQGFKLASSYNQLTLTLFIFVWIAMLTYSYWKEQTMIFYSVLILGIFLFSLRKWVYPWIVRLSFKSYEEVIETMTIELLEDGVMFTNSKVENLQKWEDIYNWKDNSNYILIYQARGAYQIIPKRVSQDGFDIAKLVSQLEIKVG